MSVSKIFEQTTRPDSSLFFNSGDKNDPRLGGVVRFAPEHYGSSDVVILGYSQDEAVSRRGDRKGAAAAPDAIRDQFYRLTTFNLKKNIFDLGNLSSGGSVEEAHDEMTSVAKQILEDEELMDSVLFPDEGRKPSIKA